MYKKISIDYKKMKPILSYFKEVIENIFVSLYLNFII